MQTLNDKGTIRRIELCHEAIDIEEWPDAPDLSRGMHRLIRPAELGIGSGKSGMVVVVAWACAEAGLKCGDCFFIASLQIIGPSDGFVTTGAHAGVETLRDLEGFDGCLGMARVHQNRTTCRVAPSIVRIERDRTFFLADRHI